MRMAIRAALVAGLLLGCRGTARFDAGDRAEIESLLAAQQAAWNRGELEAFMDGYARTPELVFTSGGQVRRGWDETLAGYRKRYGADKTGMGRLSFEILGVQPAGPGGAVVLGRWRLTDTPQAGSGVFSLVLERRPEGWRIIHDHTSAD